MKNRGISLVVLAITIVVLLILASVTISLVIGNNGLVSKTQNAKYAMENGVASDAAGLDAMKDRIEDQVLGEVAKKRKITERLGIGVGDLVSYSPEGTYEWKGEYATTENLIDKQDEQGNVITDLNGNPIKVTVYDKLLDSSAEGLCRITSWKVFKLDDGNGNILLIPSSLIYNNAKSVRIGQAQGYNNCVKMLNDACSNLYSDSSKGITARNIKIEDIESIIEERDIKNNTTYLATAKANEQYADVLNSNNQAINAYDHYKYYPLIYELEYKRVINGNELAEGLGLSDSLSRLIERGESTTLGENQTKTTNAIIGRLEAKFSIQPYMTSFEMSTADLNNALGNEYVSILGIGNNNVSYGIATRCIKCNQSNCSFSMYEVNYGALGCGGLMSSGASASSSYSYLCPIVTVSPALLEQGAGNGNFVVS